MSLLNTSVTLVETNGEDSSGELVTRSTATKAAVFYEASERLTAAGTATTDSALVVLEAGDFVSAWTQPTGYKLKSIVTPYRTLSVLGVIPVVNQRNGSLHHVEVDCG